MEKILADVPIYELTNYDEFKFIEGNREINVSKVKGIIKSITEVGFVKGRPILVTKEGCVIDGQHRLEAIRALGIKGYFKIEEGDENALILALNQNQKSWALEDYINQHAKLKVTCYQELDAFIKKHKLTPTVGIDIFIKDRTSKSGMNIRKGIPFLTNYNAEKIVSFLADCHKRGVTFSKSARYSSAVVSLFTNVNFSDAKLAKLLAGIHNIERQATTDKYLLAFGQIIYAEQSNIVINL